MNIRDLIGNDERQIDKFRQKNHMVNAGRRSHVNQVRAFGTSEGANKGWDARGRGRAAKNFTPPTSVVHKPLEQMSRDEIEKEMDEIDRVASNGGRMTRAMEDHRAELEEALGKRKVSRFNDDVPLGHVGRGLANYTVGDFLKKKKKVSRFNDDVPLGHVGRGLANYTVGDFLKKKK